MKKQIGLQTESTVCSLQLFLNCVKVFKGVYKDITLNAVQCTCRCTHHVKKGCSDTMK